MAKEDQVLSDDLLDGDEEIELEVDEAHDPMNAEAKSNDSVVKAGRTGPKAKKRPADKSNAENGGKAYKPNKGIVRELFDRMNEMSQDELRKLHAVIMSEDFDVDSIEEATEESELENVQYDFKEDLTDLVDTEATLSEGFKDKASIIMETAIKSKLRGEIARLEESYDEQLAEEQEAIVEKVDSYLSYVVENWMEENKLAVQQGLRTEIAEDFMNGLKDLFTESYIEVPEEKVDLVDDLAEKVADLESELNIRIEESIDMKEENEMFKRERVVYELGEDLADTQLDKLNALSEDIDFDDEDTFREKVAVIKETYFGSNKPTHRAVTEDLDDEDVDQVEVSGNMKNYVQAVRNSAKYN